MAHPRAKYVCSFWLTDVVECVKATVDVVDELGRRREIVVAHPGPFDSPEDLLATYLEIIDHAEWHSEQLRLPLPAVE